MLLATASLLHLRRAAILSTLMALLGCSDSLFAPPGPTLTLALSSDSVPADGVTVVEVRAVVAPTTPVDVRFQTDRGAFLVPGGAPAATATVRAVDGAAVARLSSPQVGTASVTANALDAIVGGSVVFVAALPDTIELLLSRSVVPADGSTAVTATAVLRRRIGAPTTGLPVRFSVRSLRLDSAGAWTGATVPSRGDGTAVFSLTSARPDSLAISAGVDQVVSQSRVVVFRNPPDSSSSE